jgi:hypothetical protein
MAPPLDLVQTPDAVTGPLAYVRLPGDREAVGALTPTLTPVVLDRGAQVAADAEAIRWLRGRVPVVAFVNNHFAGFAPRSPANWRPSPGPWPDGPGLPLPAFRLTPRCSP